MADLSDPPGVEHRLGPYRLRVARGYGPRITNLSRDDGPEIFASLDPSLGVTDAEGEFAPFHGGHRLWTAPETVAVTYAADNPACRVEATAAAITVTGPVDKAGLVKTISLSLSGESLEVEHRLDPGPGAPEEFSAWAITQLPLDGQAIIPLGRLGEASGSQADRVLALWPYTDLTDSRLTVSDRAIIVSASKSRPLKIGIGPDPGCLGYLRDETLFIKRFTAEPDAKYADRGAIAQVYCNDDFLELESLAPLQTAAPSTHTEFWEVVECASLDDAISIVCENTES